MHATITTWSLIPDVGDAGAVRVLFTDMVAQNLAVGLELGLLDAILLHLPPDQVVAIAIYANVTDAHKAGIVAAPRIAADFGQTLRPVRRDVGQLLTAVLPHETELGWRAHVAEMHATWAIWRVAPHLRAAGALERFVREGYERFASMVRQLGLIDMLMIRLPDDELAILNLYADPVVGRAAYAEAVTAVADYTEGHMERIAAHTGRAFDLAMLISRAA
jgi:hypothetical protein